MKEMCSIITPYKCPNCGKNSMFFTTRRNTLISYEELLSNGRTIPDIKEILTDKDVKTIKCVTCGTTYCIDWSNTVPMPLSDKNYLKRFGM